MEITENYRSILNHCGLTVAIGRAALYILVGGPRSWHNITDICAHALRNGNEGGVTQNKCTDLYWYSHTNLYRSLKFSRLRRLLSTCTGSYPTCITVTAPVVQISVPTYIQKPLIIRRVPRGDPIDFSKYLIIYWPGQQKRYGIIGIFRDFLRIFLMGFNDFLEFF